MHEDSHTITVLPHGQELKVVMPHTRLGEIIIEVANASAADDPTAFVAIWIPHYSKPAYNSTIYLDLSDEEEAGDHPTVQIAGMKHFDLGIAFIRPMAVAENLVRDMIEGRAEGLLEDCGVDQGAVSSLSYDIVRALIERGLIGI